MGKRRGCVSLSPRAWHRPRRVQRHHRRWHHRLTLSINPVRRRQAACGNREGLGANQVPTDFRNAAKSLMAE